MSGIVQLSFLRPIYMIIMVRIVALKASYMIFLDASSIKGLLTIMGDQPFLLNNTGKNGRENVIDIGEYSVSVCE